MQEVFSRGAEVGGVPRCIGVAKEVQQRCRGGAELDAEGSWCGCGHFHVYVEGEHVGGYTCCPHSSVNFHLKVKNISSTCSRYA